MMREDNYGNFVSKSKATVRMWKVPVKGRRLGMETSQEEKDVAGYKCANLEAGICRMLGKSSRCDKMHLSGEQASRNREKREGMRTNDIPS